ncbi:DUF1700 domain-containing protein [Saccharothrix hoggarensis]|uniref:DUF1700 domain-containing protein n=1 Tax=Saccharothrix hoggarensis TaxID=913853 RepID=A0ABW3QTN1_9PSEU
MNTQANTEVRDYLDRMREALSDLPAAEVGEIMDDAGAHVVEVAEEMGEDFTPEALIGRLGTPRAYARELRAAAGYPSPTEAGPAEARPTGVARFAFWSLVVGTVVAFGFAFSRGDGEELVLLVCLALAAAALLVFRQPSLLPEVARLPEAAALADALRKLEQADTRGVLRSLRTFQPLWWIGRSLLIAWAGVLVGRLSSMLVVSLALAALALVSGPKARTDRRWLWISVPATGLALGVLLLLAGALVDRMTYRDAEPVSYSRPTPVPANVYVFDKDGKPVTDVYLYDENGQPLEQPWYGCDESRHDNRYPKPRVVHDETGCHEVPGVPFAVVMPTTPAPTPSVSPLPTTSLPTTSPSTTSLPSPPASPSPAPSTVTTTAPTTPTG